MSNRAYIRIDARGVNTTDRRGFERKCATDAHPDRTQLLMEADLVDHMIGAARSASMEVRQRIR